MPDPAEEERNGFAQGPTDAPIPVQGRPVEQRASVLEFLGELPILIICAIALAWIIKSFVAQPFFIPSQSMEQTLLPGDRVVVSKVNYRVALPSPGEVVVFEAPERSGMSDQDFIKRIVAGPGDEVEVRAGRLFVNGRGKSEAYTEPDSPNSEFGPETVPKDSVFVMGDNRANSKDSRFFGAVPKEDIVGKAVAIYWPLNRVGLVR